jgi:hypothetical protein
MNGEVDGGPNALGRQLAPMIDCLSLALEGRYRVERAFGAGGVARVFLAADLKRNQESAMDGAENVG